MGDNPRVTTSTPASGAPTDEADFRCSGASERSEEPMEGTAPDEAWWLLVEYPGPWGRKAIAESRLDPAVRDHLAGLHEVRVHLIRRHVGPHRHQPRHRVPERDRPQPLGVALGGNDRPGDGTDDLGREFRITLVHAASR